MASRYIIKYNDGAVEMTKPNSTILIYKIPYTNLKALNPGFVIPNQFIVYICSEKTHEGKTCSMWESQKMVMQIAPRRMTINMRTGQPAIF